MSVIEEWNRVNRTKKREAIEMEYQLARGEIYEIPSEESHQGEPSTKRRSQLENEEDIFDDAITNDSKDDVMGNDEAFESSGCEDDNEPTMDFFNFENAVSYVAAIFLHNNFSDSVAKDIFTIGKVLNQHPSIRLSDVNRKVEEWSDYDPRIYSFCVECKNLLSSANKCGNLNCGRNGVSQANVSNGNVVVTYSIKKQVQQILDNMEIGDEILTRHTTPTSLCSRCVDTPKYKERLRKSIQINPQLLPLLVSVNIDGFSRKGTSRGSYWPVFVVVHDLNFGSGRFEEYRPEHVLLSAIIKTSSTFTHNYFESALERLNLDIKSTTIDPLLMKVNGVDYKACLQIYQSVLDMDASKKIHGYPNWKKYGSCGRCNVRGRRIKVNKGFSISWYPGGAVAQYSNHNFPTDAIRITCLPPPWNDGYDALHLINEGTTRDLLKDLLGNGKRMKLRLSKDMKIRWAKALKSAQTPKGMSSATLLDPLQLSARSGSEVQMMYNLVVPTLLLCLSESNLSTFTILLHWISTRMIIDCHLTPKTCGSVARLSRGLCSMMGQYFPQLYSMKFHYTFNHLVETLRFDGSPLLSSAAPFERLNQVMGRNNCQWTTRATLDMSKRFTGLNKALVECRKSVESALSPVKWPQTMKSLKPVTEKLVPKNNNTDEVPLNNEELMVIESKFPNFSSGLFHIRASTSTSRGTFSTRHNNSASLTKSCFVYYIDGEDAQFGSIERIIETPKGDFFLLLYNFKTIDPFENLRLWASQRSQLRKCVDTVLKSNQFYRKIVGYQWKVIHVNQIEGYFTMLEFGNCSYASRY
ncbi:unnamed protein product [Caenorhabditis nigoni]|uniref:Transposase domain-containing protein n=1 Tax=Caenorhabditis nigoni TaxID=1611254 RepID=A0A2G5T5I6_9PELO|nr:hypothetical protein B9Z55_016438 [Caenorhabditis nigoni]